MGASVVIEGGALRADGIRPQHGFNSSLFDGGEYPLQVFDKSSVISLSGIEVETDEMMSPQPPALMVQVFHILLIIE